MRIIDLSWRLPGPLATYFLAKQGFEVIKYEDRNHRDPFLKWHWDPAFADVYRAFQAEKTVRLIDFSDEADARALREQIAESDAVVMSFPPRIEVALGLTEQDIEREFGATSFVRLGFRQGDNHAAHDLNTLAQSHLLRMHILDRTDDIIAPPFLPATGIFFSYHIATTVVTTILRQRSRPEPIQTWCYLQDAVDHVQQAYYPEAVQSRSPATFLHNGRFPAYNCYRTADGGYLAVAAVEPKFWSTFREVTGLTHLADDDGLCHGERADVVKAQIVAAVRSRTSEEWEAAFAGHNACVDVLYAEAPDRDAARVRRV